MILKNNMLTCITLFFFLGCTAASILKPNKTYAEQSVIKTTIDLTDNSRIIGTLSSPSIPLQTSFSKVDIPLEQILNITFQSDEKTVSVNLRNKDRFSGILASETIDVTTIFGEISINIENIKKIAFYSNTIMLFDGLVAYYPFNGNAKDESGNGNNGKVHGAVLSKDKSGNANSSYSFNGRNDYIEVPGSQSLNFDTTITITSWVYINKFNSNMQIVQKDSANFLHAYAMPILSNSGNSYSGIKPRSFGLELTLNGKFTSNMWSKTQLKENIWYFLAVTYSGSKVNIYLNGSLDSSYKASGKIETNAKPVRIGNFRNESRDCFNGIMNDVHIYNRALSESDINKLYESGI